MAKYNVEYKATVYGSIEFEGTEDEVNDFINKLETDAITVPATSVDDVFDIEVGRSMMIKA